MTDPLTPEVIAELRHLQKLCEIGGVGAYDSAHDRFFNAALKRLPALLDLAERPSNGEADTRAKSLEEYADGIAMIAETSKTKDGWLKALAGVLRDTAALLRKLSAGESGGWQPIATAPKEEWVLVYRPGGEHRSRGVRADIRMTEFNNRWAHSAGDNQPTHWMPLPEPPR